MGLDEMGVRNVLTNQRQCAQRGRNHEIHVTGRTLVHAVTRERIRQIESKGLKRLRSSENAHRLRPLMTIQ